MSHSQAQEPAKKSSYKSAGVFDLVAFTVGAKISTVINVGLMLKTCKGVQLAEPAQFKAYLSDVVTGLDITGTVPDGGVAIGTNGKILASLVTNKMWELVSKADGTIDLSITHSGTHTYYLIVVDPIGSVIASTAIVF